MADLVVDYDLLTELARNMAFVDQEFRNLTGEVHGIDNGSGWGSDDIHSAMNTFQHNWRAHRAKLESAIDALSQMVTQTTGTFQDTDRQLAQALAADDAPAAQGGDPAAGAC